MHWRMQHSWFHFNITYETGLSNTQADALSPLYLLEETTVPIDEYNTTVLRQSNQSHATTNDLHGSDDLNEALVVTTTTPFLFFPTTLENIHLLWSGDKFCSMIRACLTKREKVPFAFNIGTVLFRSIDGFEQIVVAQSVVSRVL